MLVDIFAGRDHCSASPRGSFHFSRSPEPGEKVEIDGEILTVTRAWHRPDVHYAGAKFAILVAAEIDRADLALPLHDDAGVPV